LDGSGIKIIIAMKILIKDWKEAMLNEKVPMHHRGLLFTIFLCQQPNPKHWLGIVEKEIDMKKERLHLCLLHKRGYIEWSGYDAASKLILKKETEDELLPKVREVIVFMNKIFKRKYNPEGKNLTLLRAVLAEGYSVDDCKKVISNRYVEWKDDPVSEKWLNTATPFRKKMFPVYLEEAGRTRQGESLLNIENINLQDGDEITAEIANTFVDNNTYRVKVYDTDDDGNRRGNGRIGTRYGRDIKKTVKLEDNKIKLGFQREYRYHYKQN
jgi:uncharacterized phage protein (TIGR02220 family)